MLKGASAVLASQGARRLSTAPGADRLPQAPPGVPRSDRTVRGQFPKFGQTFMAILHFVNPFELDKKDNPFKYYTICPQTGMKLRITLPDRFVAFSKRYHDSKAQTLGIQMDDTMVASVAEVPNCPVREALQTMPNDIWADRSFRRMRCSMLMLNKEVLPLEELEPLTESYMHPYFEEIYSREREQVQTAQGIFVDHLRLIPIIERRILASHVSQRLNWRALANYEDAKNVPDPGVIWAGSLWTQGWQPKKFLLKRISRWLFSRKAGEDKD
eukprot:gnl/Spiro4/8216_TR4341_c0_g1_i1.p1 gnl/Spiro4/8216_TR4341_c0_g1~~gnl/Spiro4/8216_TR4341_c0_g1_i1.p1  ORF type:complete len:284 (-),score=31.36 gnl/Spiro4/8216_TR4341_c0_g1_i1:94-906(-)